MSGELILDHLRAIRVGLANLRGDMIEVLGIMHVGFDTGTPYPG